MNKKERIAIIGGGISGASIGKMLNERYGITIFEQKEKLGGLISCDRVDGALFHKVGGHVFNTKNEKVADWFWSFFNQKDEFLKAKRNAKIYIYDSYVGYPIENYLYQLPIELIKKCVSELLELKGKNETESEHFDQFLKNKFGPTLYEIYFKPYNAKIWNTKLDKVPLPWLDGKLPMPDIKEIFLHNILRQEEGEMVHSSFYYPVKGGSQFIIDRISQELNTECNVHVHTIIKQGDKYLINDNFEFDKVIYTGDIRRLHQIINTRDEIKDKVLKDVANLKSNGTSNYLCETDNTDISWLYLPENKYKAHRIIYTGNFSKTNNPDKNRKTCVVEFSGKHDPHLMEEEIKKLPGNLKPIQYNYEPNSYIIHEPDTSVKINKIKEIMHPEGFYLLGRFAEWQYYNMDKCIESAMEIKKQIDES